jgi:hypothetical protein
MQGNSQHEYGEFLNLCHFGSLAKDRSLSIILKAASKLFEKYPEARRHLRIHAYGAPLDSLSHEAVSRYGFSDILYAHGRLEKNAETGMSGREQVAQKMQEADVLILLHGNDEWCAEYIPSKFYDYLWSGRPIWGVTHRNPQLDQMLSDRNSYLSADGDDEGIAAALEKIWLDWQQKRLLEPIWQPIGVDQAVSSILSHIDK